MFRKIVQNKTNWLSKMAAVPAICFYAAVAHAQSLPWETPLCTFANALTGKTAFGIAVIVMFATGVALVWGEEIKGVMKSLVVAIMVISILISGAAIIRWLFPSVISC
jgi:type IV secretion system protein VirB2